VHVLEDNPVLLLFVVAALGVLGARIRVRGFSFGVTAVLFAGIALGAIDSKLVLPEAIWVLGLAIFVYTTGLASGPGFIGVLYFPNVDPGQAEPRRGLRVGQHYYFVHITNISVL